MPQLTIVNAMFSLSLDARFHNRNCFHISVMKWGLIRLTETVTDQNNKQKQIKKCFELFILVVRDSNLLRNIYILVRSS